MERYQPSLFNLALNASTELKRQLDALNNLMPGVRLEESEFYSKREKLLDFHKEHRDGCTEMA